MIMPVRAVAATFLVVTALSAVAVPSMARATDPQPAASPSPSDSPSPAPSESPTTSPTSPPGARITTTSGWYGLNRADTITIDKPIGPGRFPAVIFIHGGAWGRSQPNSYELNWARDLAQQQRWLVAVIGYPAKVAHEEVREPYAIAIALRTIAHRSDVDVRAIALWGESAGAQLALLAAYRDARTLHPLVSAVVSISGPTVMRTEYNSFAQVWLHAVTRFEGMSPDAARAAGSRRYPLTSPADIVCRRDPPTFQAISRLDPLVPSNQVKVLTQRLIKARVFHRTVWLRGDGHSTAIETEYPPGSNDTVQQLAESFIDQAFAQRRAG
jgi:acetyl esterase/lipase